MLALRRWVADRCWDLHVFFQRGWMLIHPESWSRFDRPKKKEETYYVSMSYTNAKGDEMAQR